MVIGEGPVIVVGAFWGIGHLLVKSKRGEGSESVGDYVR